MIAIYITIGLVIFLLLSMTTGVKEAAEISKTPVVGWPIAAIAWAFLWPLLMYIAVSRAL